MSTIWKYTDLESERRQIRLWERQMTHVNWLYVVKWGSAIMLATALVVAIAKTI